MLYPVSIRVSFLLVLSLILASCKDSSVGPLEPQPIAKVVFTDQDGYLCQMEWDGSNKVRLFDQIMWEPLASPLGSYVAGYEFFDDVRETWLVLLNTKSGQLKKLAFIQGIDESGIMTHAWSPNGQFVAFNRGAGFSASNICLVDTAGDNFKQLTQGGFNIDPRWSPDNAQIAFWASTNGSLSCYMMNSDGSGMRAAPFCPKGVVFQMCWSPSALQIAFDGVLDSSDISAGKRDIFIVDRDGQHLNRITSDGQSAAPTWSPDGNFVAFESKRDGGMNLYILNTIDGKQSKLTNHGKVAGYPYRWSPDSKKIIYAYNPGAFAPSTLYVVCIDASADIDTQAPFRGGFSWLTP
jgi:Tol biopolymer transport system component